MKVKRVGYVAVRTPDVEATTSFFSDVLESGGRSRRAAEAFDNPDHRDFGWFFVRMPDGRVCAIEQVPD
jgi:hypothetical protein